MRAIILSLLLGSGMVDAPAAATDPGKIDTEQLLADDQASNSTLRKRPIKIVVSRAANVDMQSRQTVQIISSRPRAYAKGLDAAPSTPSGSPVAAGLVTSDYGRRYNPVTRVWANHRGIDLAATHGSPVYATADGVVTTAGWLGSYGMLVVVRHGAGVETRYAHLSGFAVSVGMQIRSGEVLGYVGSTGRSTGPHLHYEIRRDGISIDPRSTING